MPRRSVIRVVRVSTARAELVLGPQISGVPIGRARLPPPLHPLLLVELGRLGRRCRCYPRWLQSRMNGRDVGQPHIEVHGDAGEHGADIADDELDDPQLRPLRGVAVVQGRHGHWHGHDVRARETGLQRAVVTGRGRSRAGYPLGDVGATRRQLIARQEGVICAGRGSHVNSRFHALLSTFIRDFSII